MNKYIITAREIERMLNLAAMEEAGCLSRAGKEELNELVARVQEVIDELAAWWKEIKRNKEEIKAKNAEAKKKGRKRTAFLALTIRRKNTLQRTGYARLSTKGWEE